jgi:hypothetical protein
MRLLEGVSMKLGKIVLIYFFITINLFYCGKANAEISYQQIANLYFAINNQEIPVVEQSTAFNFNISDTFNLIPPALNEQEKLKILFNILSLHNKNNNADPLNECLLITLKDLEIPQFLSKLNNTHTIIGHVLKSYLFCNPTNDVTLLESRQSFIKELINNEKLFNELSQQLSKIKNAESGFFSFWHAEDPIAADFFRKLYWHILPDSYNKSPYALEFGIRFNNLMIASLFALVPGIIYSRQKNIIEGFHKILAIDNPKKKITVISGLSVGLLAYAGFLFYRYKLHYETAKQVKDSINYMQTRLIDVATLLNAYNEIHEIVGDKYPLKNATHSQDFIALTELLKTDTFTGEASFFSFSGRVLAGFRLMHEIKNEFALLLEYIGIIDVLLSIAELMKKTNDRTSYNFVNYVDKGPFLRFNNFWHPMIPTEKVVTNSIELKKDSRNIILTGSNMSGKSTILKALMINILLAQTFGIVAAEQGTLAPFSSFASKLKVIDNIITGDSLFQAEANRIKLFFDVIGSLKKNEYGIVIIDELFSGTSCEKGEKASYTITKDLAVNNENILSVITTHFQKLTELEKELPEITMNYKIDAYKDAQGNLIRPFKLEKGISIINSAFDILNSQIEHIVFKGAV